MAEVVGLVAGGAGFASLAFQLLESAQKVEQLYANFRGAPRRLTRLLRGSEAFGVSVTLAGAEVCEGIGSEHARNLETSIKLCQESLDEVETAIKRLEKTLARSKSFGRAAVALHEPQLQSLCDQLERGMASLNFAFNIYSEWRRQQGDARRDRSLANIESIVQQSSLALSWQLEWIARVDREPAKFQQRSVEPTIKVARRNPKRQGKQSVVHIRLPKWLTGRVWRFAADRAETGWDWSLHTLRMVPLDSLIFRACHSGDIELVLQLLSSGEASVHDTTMGPDGRFVTPILEATLQGSVETCRLLLTAGRRADQWDALHAALSQFPPNYKSWSTMPIPEIQGMLLEDLIEKEGLLFEPSLKGSTILSRAHLPIALQSQHILQSRACLEYSSWPLSTRVELCGRVRKHSLSPAFLLESCTIPTSCQEFRDLPPDDQIGVLLLLLEGPPIQDLCTWLNLAQSICQSGNQALGLWTWLTFGYIDWKRFYMTNDHLKCRLIHWLRALAHQKVDLKEYGVTVESQWSSDFPFAHDDNEIGSDEFESFCISSISHGPHITDWALNLVSHRSVPLYQLQPVPGAWPEPACLPQIIWGKPSRNDEHRGKWIHVATHIVWGQRQVRARNSLDEDMLEAYADLLTDCQGDEFVLSSMERGRPKAQHSIQGRQERGRSQPASRRSLDLTIGFAKRYDGLCWRKLRRNSSLWIQDVEEHFLQRHGAPPLWFSLGIIWQEHVEDLFVAELHSLPPKAARERFDH